MHKKILFILYTSLSFATIKTGDQNPGRPLRFSSSQIKEITLKVAHYFLIEYVHKYYARQDDPNALNPKIEKFEEDILKYKNEDYLGCNNAALTNKCEKTFPSSSTFSQKKMENSVLFSNVFDINCRAKECIRDTYKEKKISISNFINTFFSSLKKKTFQEVIEEEIQKKIKRLLGFYDISLTDDESRRQIHLFFSQENIANYLPTFFENLNNVPLEQILFENKNPQLLTLFLLSQKGQYTLKKLYLTNEAKFALGESNSNLKHHLTALEYLFKKFHPKHEPFSSEPCEQCKDYKNVRTIFNKTFFIADKENPSEDDIKKLENCIEDKKEDNKTEIHRELYPVLSDLSQQNLFHTKRAPLNAFIKFLSYHTTLKVISPLQKFLRFGELVTVLTLVSCCFTYGKKLLSTHSRQCFQKGFYSCKI